MYRFFETLSVCHTVQVGGSSDTVGDNDNNNNNNNSSNQNTNAPTITAQQVAATMMMIPVPNSPHPISPLAVEQHAPVFRRDWGNQDQDPDEGNYDFDEASEEVEEDRGKAEAAEPKEGVVVNRRNNVAGLPNSGDSNPLLLNGTVNVVTDSVSDRLQGNLAFQNELKATINNFKSELKTKD